MFTDLGIGYYLMRSDSDSNLLTAIAPTLEVHVGTPLRQANPIVNDNGIFDNLRIKNVVDF